MLDGVLISNRQHHGLRYRHRFHQLAVLPQIPKIQIGSWQPVTVGRKGFECDHPFRVATTGKRVQQHGSHPAENGCVRADSKRKRKNRDCRNSRILAEHAQGETEVLEQGFEKGETASVSIIFLGLFQATQFQQRRAPRLFRGHARTQVVLNVHREVALQLIRQLAIAAVLLKQPA